MTSSFITISMFSLLLISSLFIMILDITRNHIALGFPPNGTTTKSGANPLATPNITRPQNLPAFVKVLLYVNNTGGGTAKPSDFTVSVVGDNNPNPSSFDGSEKGTIVAMGPGSYSLGIQPKDTVNGTYGTSYSGSCALNVGFYTSLGEGGAKIHAGEKQICIVTQIFPNFK